MQYLDVRRINIDKKYLSHQPQYQSRQLAQTQLTQALKYNPAPSFKRRSSAKTRPAIQTEFTPLSLYRVSNTSLASFKRRVLKTDVIVIPNVSVPVTPPFNNPRTEYMKRIYVLDFAKQFPVFSTIRKEARYQTPKRQTVYQIYKPQALDLNILSPQVLLRCQTPKGCNQAQAALLNCDLSAVLNQNLARQKELPTGGEANKFSITITGKDGITRKARLLSPSPQACGTHEEQKTFIRRKNYTNQTVTKLN
jgi:hypothetical protein